MVFMYCKFIFQNVYLSSKKSSSYFFFFPKAQIPKEAYCEKQHFHLRRHTLLAHSIASHIFGNIDYSSWIISDRRSKEQSQKRNFNEKADILDNQPAALIHWRIVPIPIQTTYLAIF